MADQRQPPFRPNFQQIPQTTPGPPSGIHQDGPYSTPNQWNQVSGKRIEPPQNTFNPLTGQPPRPLPNALPPGTINGHSQGNPAFSGAPNTVMNGPPGNPLNWQGMPPTSGQRLPYGPVIPPNVSHQPSMPPSSGQSAGFPPLPSGQRMPPFPGGQAPSFNGQRPPLMGQRPPVSMGQGPPQMGQRPPQMGQRPPVSMGQRPPVSMSQGPSPPIGHVPPPQFVNQGMVGQGAPSSQVRPGQGAPSQPPFLGSSANQGIPPPPVSLTSGPAPSHVRPMYPPPPGPGMHNQSAQPPIYNNTQQEGINDRPNELPVPYHGQAQYSHQIGPSIHLSPAVTPGTASEPASNKSSRSATPISGHTYDALEGQFTPNKQGFAPSPLASQPPVNQDMGQRSTGITGRRQYPQQPPPPGDPQMMPTYPGNYPNKPIDPLQPGGGVPPYGNLQAPVMPPPTLPVSNQYQQNKHTNDLTANFRNLGFNDTQQSQVAINLLNEKHLIHHEGLETVKPTLNHDFKKVHCNPEIFRCTLNAMPQTSTLLNKSRLPLGILIHPFKDLSQLPVIQSSVIVRCRSCRTYINPFVHFVDTRRWKCNLCYRVNDLPEEFSFDPVSKTYGDPQRRPEIRSATIEFIAPSEYMLRPPQPAVYLYLLDVSFNALGTGYLTVFCQTLLEELDKIPGDSRTQIGFLCYDRSLYFFNLAEGLSQPQMLIVPDLDDVFLPLPDDLLVNLHGSKDLVIDLLNRLPSLFEGNMETGSALGAALQAGYKLMSSTGGRITVVQTVLPTVGQGALQVRESTTPTAKNIPHLGPATDFYKKLALDCSAQQIAVDLFLLNGQYADIATLSCISKYSAGCIYYYPSFHTIKNTVLSEKFEADLRRYLTRKIGFESVMRIRCTRGLSIHTFHGNFFVRSTDLLSLPNINPDAGFGMQMSIEDTLVEASTVCFQAALLYTSSKGERRIRVHTLCLPVTNQISEVYNSADQQAIVSLLAKMAVDRSLTSTMGDARDALMNAAVDCLGAYSTQLTSSQKVGALVLPHTLRIIPLFVLALLKSTAFKGTTNTKTDDRVFALQQFKVLPISYLLQCVYSHMYPVHNITEQKEIMKGGTSIRIPPLLQLSSANIDRHGVYIMDTGQDVYMIVGGSVSDVFCQSVLDKPNFMSIPETMLDLPEMDNPASIDLRNFINYLLDNRPNGTTFLVMRDDSKARHLFYQHMVEDRTESSMSYYEFLQYIQQQVK